MGEDRKRHCWECCRRSLVCDSTQPECKRCTASGNPCPGYGKTEPLRLKWLPPGKVKARKAKRTRNCAEMTTSITTTENTMVMAKPCREVKTDAHTFFEAAEYFNTHIFPGIFPILELGSNSTVYQISSKMFQNGMGHPDYVRLGMVCMSLSHRMNQTRDKSQMKALSMSFLYYRGLIIRSLNEDINVDHKRKSNLVVAGILTILIADSQQGASTFWRYHLQGVQRIIALRGGMGSFAESTGAIPLLLLFVNFGVIGDTTSPASDLAIVPSHLEQLNFVIEHYGNGPFAFQGFPTPLFADIIRINCFRQRATKSLPIIETEDLTYEAYEILNRIQSFSSEQWAESKLPSRREEWTLLGNIRQAAVALYCIHSLQSTSVLPLIPFLRESCFLHSQQLQRLLKRAIPLPSLRLFMLWPLVVLGVEAVNGDLSMQAFVQEKLSELSRYTGMLAPLTAKDVLERFWNSGRTDWDSCFERPYAFIMVPAVDVSKLS